MEQQKLVFKKSDLQKARDAKQKWVLDAAFTEAEKVIKAGGVIKIQQRFSDNTMELVDIFDDLNQLESFKNKYLIPEGSEKEQKNNSR